MQHYSEHRIRLTGTPKELKKIKSIWGTDTVEVTRQILRLTATDQVHQIYLFKKDIIANVGYSSDRKYTTKPKHFWIARSERRPVFF